MSLMFRLMIPQYAAWLLGLVPLLWLATHRDRRRVYWLIAAAYGVSFLADTGGLLGWPDLFGNLYPLGQAGLIGAALLDRGKALHLAGALTLAALLAVWLGAWQGRDLLLVTAADVAILVLAHRALYGTLLGFALFVSFGLGLVCWWAYAEIPSTGSWALYQFTRVAGTGLFCWAAVERAEA